MGQHVTKQPNGKYAIFSSVVDHFIAYGATPDEIRDEFRQSAIEESDRQTKRSLERADHLGESRIVDDLETVARVHGQPEADKYREIISLITEVDSDSKSTIAAPDTPIRPDHIKDGHLYDAFGSHDSEASAGWLVKLAKSRGSWLPFTWGEIQALYQAKWPGYTFHFNGLDNRVDGVISSGGERTQDQTFAFTSAFVATCYLASVKHPDC